MSSPMPDDYMGLMTPWKPIPENTTKNVTSIHHGLEIEHGIKDRDAAGTESINATVGVDYVKREDVEPSETDSMNTNPIIGGRAKEDSEIEGLGTVDIDDDDVDGSIGDGAQVDGAEAMETENEEPQHIDTKCVAVSTCVANSGDHRKVVSHIFGRNKACTRELPNDLWIFWCRKHYQRFKYRAEDAENWHTIQLGLVRNQLQTFEDWGEVRTWTIALRRAELDAISKENKNGFIYTDYVSSCWERFLVPYLGSNKTFAQVRQVLNTIECKFHEAEYHNRDKKLKTFPGVEFLPNVQKVKEVKKPAVKGETVYKKITLDQPAFSRKTRANTQFIKDMAAKNGEASNTLKSSGTASEKHKSPYTGNASDVSVTKQRKSPDTDSASDVSATKKRKSPDTDSASDVSATKKRKSSATANATNDTHHKRESVDSTTQTPPSFKFRSLPTERRRRLTRGFEKHGSDGEDTTFKEKEDHE